MSKFSFPISRYLQFGVLLQLSLSFSFLFGQAHLSVEVTDRIYGILEASHAKGYLKKLPGYRPYSNDQVYKYLEEIYNGSDISEAERGVIEREMRRFERNITLEETKSVQDFLSTGRVAVIKETSFPMNFRLMGDFENQFDMVSSKLNSMSLLSIAFEGDMYSLLSYRILFGVGLGVRSDQPYPYYGFTKRDDGHPVSVGGNVQKGTTSFSGDSLSFMFKVGGQLAASYGNGLIHSGASYQRRNFGIGYGSLIYSSRARPMMGTEFLFRPVDWFSLNFVAGSLGGFDQSTSTSKAMFTAQQLEFFLGRYVYLGLTMGSVWPKRQELLYLMPFIPVVLVQAMQGDYDNVGLQGTIGIHLPFWNLSLYGVGFSDEVQPADAKNLFREIKQQFAFQAGLKFAVPKIPFTMFQFQYTRIEPYAYTHYAQKPFSASKNERGSINISWLNDSENLGYYLQPNSDEFLFRLETNAFAGWTFSLNYQHIRHGDGDPQKGQVEGRTNSVYENTVDKVKNGSSITNKLPEETDKEQIYNGIYSDEYFNNKVPRKNFLQDGPYEYIHNISLDVSYRLDQFPLEITGSYVIAFNDGPVYKGTKGPAEVRHALGVWLKFYGR